MNLTIFRDLKFPAAIKQFFKELNVPVNYVTDDIIPVKEILNNTYKDNDTFGLIDEVYITGMVDDAAFEGNKSLAIDNIKSDYDGILIFGVTLQKRENDLLPTRTQLAEIARAFNREFFYTPVVVIFKYEDGKREYIALANTERLQYKQTWREGEKVGKVSLLKDIDILLPHRGQVAILDKLIIPTTGTSAVKSFSQLYFYWQSVLSISVLNKKFYEDIIEWFNKAVVEIKIPDQKSGSEKHKDFSVRLIARLIFIWFLKELKVVKDDLLLPEFENGEENGLIKPKNRGSNYYKFILQNLFFNALNCEIEDRNKDVFDIYSQDFVNSKKLKDAIFYSPFLNGGLFDIHPNDWCKLGMVNNAFAVPDKLFLDKEKGLNSILARYKFTIAENTPLEEEIAVDPEMLGRIFENLLAEQSEDTKEVARKNIGAFYTPRPVVAYMCRNILLKHLDIEIKPENSKAIVRKLLETTVIDPACGSGAFPMGMLEEMMQVLSSVDPEGKVWVAEMMKSKDNEFREHISEMFADGQIRYVKKLGLLRSCLFGVDLLEYAIEITKLRCWLSLIVEQRVDFSKPNYNLKPLPNLEFKFYKKNSLFRFYKDQNINQLIDLIDNERLLKELVNLENQYFIAKSDRLGTKEEIKDKIIKLLEKVAESKLEYVKKEYNSTRTAINSCTTNRDSAKVLTSLRKKEKELSNELAELAKFKDNIKDYFIERVVFPGIFSSESTNPGFDIVIGNPPYVNTKLISSMGINKKLEEEYGYCDDLYNHFTIRGLELLKRGGLLSYITSDTFLTLQTKKNMRIEFLGIPTITKSGTGFFAEETKVIPNCHATDIINTPKAFAALVDTAIFNLKKKPAADNQELVYIDLRKPNAKTFNISEEEWKQIKSSKENLSSWERVLEKTFAAIGHDLPKWVYSHTCDDDDVYKDEKSSLLKFKVSFTPYRKSINYAIFSPSKYNCQILEKIIKPARPIFDSWWSKIETSKLIENNRAEIVKFNSELSLNHWSLIGLLTDGGVGLQTGDNGRFVGYHSSSRFVVRCKETRIEKLWKVIEKEPKIKHKFGLLENCLSYDDVKKLLENLPEVKIWQLFDSIKEEFGLRIFGKGYIYRIIPESMVFDVSQISEKQKKDGISGSRFYVPYDKGDKEGNRWFAKTEYFIDWSEIAVNWLKKHSGQSGAGMPVVRNPQFYFRQGLCWNESLNPNSNYIKCRLKNITVNDVSSMSLYDMSELGYSYIISIINSFTIFKVVREFLNNTVKIQMNDIRKIPIKIPSKHELDVFYKKFDSCVEIKKRYFAGEIDNITMTDLLRPIEVEIDEMVNHLYGITTKDSVEEVNIEDEVTEFVFEDTEKE